MLLLTPPLMTSRMEANCSAFVVVCGRAAVCCMGDSLLRYDTDVRSLPCWARIPRTPMMLGCVKADGINRADRSDIDAAAQMGGQPLVAIAEVINSGSAQRGRVGRELRGHLL